MSPKSIMQPVSSGSSFYRKRSPKQQQQQLKWIGPTIDDIIKEAVDEPTQSTTEYQLSDVTAKSLFELCSDKARNTKRGPIVQEKVQKIVAKSPDCIHTIDEKNGYNILHVVCSNPTLNMNLPLIKLLIQTSAQCMDRSGTKLRGNRSAHGRRGSMKTLKSLALSLSNHKGVDAQLVHQKSPITGELPLHIACQNAATCSLDVLEYLIQSFPAGIWMKDNLKQNVPLHNLCKTCAEDSIPWDVVLLIVQQWPEACMVENKDGNLPLHLAVELHTQRNLRVQNFFESIFDTNDEADVVDTLEDIVLEDDDDDDSTNNDDDADEKDGCKKNEFFSLYPDFQVSAATTISRQKSTSNVAQGHLKNIISLFDEGRKVYEQEESNRYEKQLEIIEYLVDVYPGAVHIKNAKGMTPLQVALKSFRAVANHQTIEKSQCGKILDFLERVTTANFPPPVPSTTNPDTNNTDSAYEDTCSDDDSSDSSSYCSIADDSSQAPAPDATAEEVDDEGEEGGTVTEEEKVEAATVNERRRRFVVQQHEPSVGHSQDVILGSGIRSLNDIRRGSSSSLNSNFFK